MTRSTVYIVKVLALGILVFSSGCVILSKKESAEPSGNPQDSLSGGPEDSIPEVNVPLGCARSCTGCGEASLDLLFYRAGGAMKWPGSKPTSPCSGSAWKASAIIETLTGLAFNPQIIGRKSTGFLGEGAADTGFVQVDKIEFISSAL